MKEGDKGSRNKDEGEEQSRATSPFGQLVRLTGPVVVVTWLSVHCKWQHTRHLTLTAAAVGLGFDVILPSSRYLQYG